MGASNGNGGDGSARSGDARTADLPTNQATVSERPANPVDEAQPGEVIGERYELLREIGRGAFGQVFLARDRATESNVALKLFARRQSAVAVKRLRREVQLAHRVTHPGVVRIHDLVDANGRLCVSMEYVEGETLSARLGREPPLNNGELVQIATDLARALAAAHRVGVIHRDLKPANILLRASNGRPVIVDFGISRHHEEVDDAITRDGQVIGTPRYMPPEQLLAREIGPAADLYAWGLVIYEAATGKMPHQGKTATQLAVERSAATPPDLSQLRANLPPTLTRAVAHCLEADPARRPADGEALKGELADLTSTSTTQTSRVERVESRVPARHKLAAAAILVAGALLAFSLWWWRAGVLPPHDRRVVVYAENAGAPDDAWIAQPLERLAARDLGEREPRLRVVDRDRADVIVRLRYRRVPDGLQVEATAGPLPGRAHALISTTAPSLALAATQIADAAFGRLGADQPVRQPDPDEREEMQRLGARSFVAYNKYRAAIDLDFGAVLIDAEASDRAMQEIVTIDPEWAHAWVAMIDGRGLASARGRETLAQAKAKLAGSTQDPAGLELLAAQDDIALGHLSAAAARLDAPYRAHSDDLYLGWILARRVYHAAGRSQDAVAVFQRLYELRPDLQFGANVIDELRRVGRQGEVRALVEDWLRRAPESEDARAALVSVAVEDGNVDEAVRRAREQVFVHGEAPHRLANLADVLITAGQHAEASRLAEAMLRGSGPIRSRGWVRLGVIATLEGRFNVARADYESAISEGKSFPWQSGLRIAYEAARWLAATLGRSDDATRYDNELADFYRASGMQWQAAVVDFDRQLLRARKGSCPDRQRTLASLAPGPGRDVAAVEMLRSAAVAGCASCADVVKEGVATDEWNQQSLYSFGVCALEQNKLDLARDAFMRTRILRNTSTDAGTASAEVFAVLARYQLARVYERSNDRAAARAAYTDFLSHWGHADRALPVVEEARQALARLR